MLRRPSIPRGVIVILFHENSEKRVVVQPRGFVLAKFPKTGLSIFAGASREIRERLLKQASFQFFDLAIVNSAAPQLLQINLCQHSIKLCAR